MMNRPSRLGRHFAAALTTAVAASATAGVTYTPVSWVIPANIDGLYINVETLATGSAESVVAGWDINPYSATSLTWFNATGTGMMRFPGATTGSAGSLAFATVVGATGSYGSGAVTVGTAAGNWKLNQDNYFGFRFVASDGATHYGWGKMAVGATITTRTITEIAWETLPATAINVGDTGGGSGPYDPCAATNPSAAVGNNVFGFNDTAADLSLSGCSAGLTAYKANYYKFVAPATRNYDFSTCAGTQDTVLALLDGCAAGSGVIACNNDFCGTGSQVTLSATAGSTYYVVIGSASATALTNPVSMTVTPWYDPCDPANPTVAVGNNSKAVNQTTATNLNVGSMVISKANYYKFTPTADGTWSFSTCNSGAATRMAIMADCVPGSTVIASDDNSCSNGSSAVVSASLTSGVPVYVVVGGEGSDIPSPIEIVVGGPPVPACVSATVAAYGDNAFDTSVGNSGTQVVQSNLADTTTATVNKALWFKFTPTATGAFAFKTCGAVGSAGASGDTLLAIGVICPTVGGSRFNTIAFNDDAPLCSSGGTGNLASFIDATNNGATGTFAGFPLTQNLVAGSTYYICVGQYSTTTAAVTGSLNITGPEGNPCPGDLDGDGSVGGADLGLLLGAWGACPGTPCLGDLNLDGEVNGADLGLLLGQWGPCP